MNICQLDALPVELIHHLLSYFSAHEIFYSFNNVTSYIDSILISYAKYDVNLKSITRTNFDLICQYLIPNQVIGLTLSDDENTPGLVELFLSHFQINQFTHLQSLRLIEIGADYWQTIISKLAELKNLRTFLFFPQNRKDSWICNLSSEDVTQLDKSLFDSYAPILPQLYQLRLCHGDFLSSIQFPQLRHLILERSSLDRIKYICSVAPQLKSLDTGFLDYAFDTELILPLAQLNRFNLRIQHATVTMNDIERMLSSLPCLKHLELVGTFDNDVVNGQRWQVIVKNLITFKFQFDLFTQLEEQDLDSFRTSFWLEEKHLFIAYTYKRLFSVPHFSTTNSDENFRDPLYSTAPNNTILYDHIDHLQLTEVPDHVKTHYNHVQTLTLDAFIPLSSLEKTVNLSRVKHLVLNCSLKNIPVMSIINEMSNLRQISIKSNIKDFLKQVHGQIIETVQTLRISNRFIDRHYYKVENLANTLKNIKHLYVEHKCSIIQIYNFLDRFKHLSTASFRYVSWFASEQEVQQCRRKIQLILNRLRRVQRLNYTYRFDCSSIHIWIR